MKFLSLALFFLSHLLPSYASAQPLSFAKETAARALERSALLAAAEIFCTELRKETVHGIPIEDQMRRLGPLLTPELRNILERARVLQGEQIRKYPDETPPWIEGDLFSSSFEGVTSWELSEVFNAPSADATVKVKRTYSDSNQDPVIWTDTLVFRRQEGNWLLDDIRMGGDWAFKSGDSLRSTLPGGGWEYENHLSLDERRRVVFEPDGDEVTRVSVQPADSTGPTTLLYGSETDESCPMPTWMVWSPDGDRIALRLGDGPRFARTLIFRLEGNSWLPVPMPEFFPEERRALDENGFRERHRLIDAKRWHDANTLVVKYFGLFDKVDKADGFFRLIHVRLDARGNAAVVGWVEAPDEE